MEHLVYPKAPSHMMGTLVVIHNGKKTFLSASFKLILKDI